jgi:tetratricopeptide (TPR) repeat protein
MPLAPIDLKRERRLVEGLVECAERGLIGSAHDIAQGGLAVALAEACFNPGGVVGAEVELQHEVGAEELFGEGASTVIISAPAENIEVISQLLRPLEVRQIGRVSASPRLKIGTLVDEDVLGLMRLYEEALRFKHDYAEAHINLGNVFLQEGKVNDAIGHYEQALRSKPDYADAHYALGIALEQAGRVREAIGHHEQALRIKPDFTDARNALAKLQAGR